MYTSQIDTESHMTSAEAHMSPGRRDRGVGVVVVGGGGGGGGYGES